MANYIRNQDKDKVYPMDIMSLHPQIRTDLHDTVQLTMQYKDKTVILGDFSTLGHVVTEISQICRCREKMYTVGGYSNGGMVMIAEYLQTIVIQLRQLINELKRLNRNLEK